MEFRRVLFRSQKLRKGTAGGKVRYANRGGRNKEWYAQLARDGRLAAQSTGKGKGKGKQKDKDNQEGKTKGKFTIEDRLL